VEEKNRSRGLAQSDALKADVVVIGAGVSGLVAGLAVAEGGATVILFEKADKPGGPLNAPGGSAGFFAAESRMQRQKYNPLTRDEAFKTIMNYSHWRANALLARAFVDKSADTIEWFEQRGAEFTDGSPMGMFIGSHYTQHFVKGGGAALLKVLLDKSKENGVEIRLQRSAKKIIKEGDRVIGVMVGERSQETMPVEAKAVIIATGGYANNKEMIKKYTGFDLGRDLFVARDVGLTGDGIQMAWEAGAAEEGLGVLILNFTIPGPGIAGTELDVIKRQPYLLVNKHGRRFCDEETVTNWPYAGNAIAKQKDKVGFLIFDGNTVKYMEEKGLDHGATTSIYLPSTKLINFDTRVRSAMDAGNKNVFVANSLKELAGQIAVDPAALQKTVNEYNQFCERGHDDLFAKNPKYLQPVKQPKFYAFRMVSHFLATLGGIKINENTEVLNRDHEVIPGLYATGNDSVGLYGDTYDLWLPATAFGFAMNSGRIAAENALRYISR
jgi:fumarate reductase flavoprotein subunit